LCFGYAGRVGNFHHGAGYFGSFQFARDSEGMAVSVSAV
jgi:hypothetical protein